MKKVFSVLLALVMTFSCLPFTAGITAHAEQFETEQGVQVKMAPFLYKSALYQMEFPSHQSIAARSSQYRQLAEFIKARSTENNRPVIVTGDFNNHMHVHEDDGALYKTLYEECGLKDAWIEYHNNGDYFNLYKWHISGLEAWGNWDSVERFMYKSGGGVDIVVSDFRYVEVCDDNGNAISDHSAAECDFTFIKTEDFVENTQELKVTDSPKKDFIHRLMWFVTALMKVLSDIGNLPELLKEI